MSETAQLIVAAPYALSERGGRPRRHLDPEPLPACARAVVGAWFKNDEELEREYHRKQRGTLQRMRAAMRLIVRNHAALRRARMIYCLDGMEYALLLLLARCGLFRTEGKVIRRVAFHDTAWQKLAPRLKNAAPAFQIECITREQLESATQELGEQRVVPRPWKIDAEWFLPAEDTPKTRAILPGNISRDESIVAPLLQRGLSITRIGRADALRERFETEMANPRFELVTNATHREYLAHLHSAPMVLLPIVPCDGSAGLTAAMEAISAGVPVLANRSMGLSELFSECRYPVRMLESLDPSEWAHACQQLDEERNSPEFLNDLENSRQIFLKHHSVLPAGEDWAQMLAEACRKTTAPCGAAFGEATPVT